MSRSISVGEVTKNNTADNLWTVIDGVVYDLTDFALDHPGGSAIIYKNAGRDATAAYSEIHAPSIIKNGLPASKVLGVLDKTTITTEWVNASSSLTAASKASLNSDEKLPLDTLISTYDFENVASRTLTAKTWAFYSSAATDLHTKLRNNTAYTDIGLRPRILIDVHEVNTTTSMLGQKMHLPLFCSPSAMAKLVHPEGEKALARGCKAAGVPQCISTNASFPIEEIFEAAKPGAYGPSQGSSEESSAENFPMFFQLYVDKQRHKSEALLKRAEALGAKAVFVTVDAPIPGKREADERVKADESLATPNSGMKAKNDSKGGSLGRIMGSYIDSSLSWKDISWLRKITGMKIVLKGVQTAMDAKKAADYGIDGIILSNHGGRSLDTAPTPVLLLLELQKCCPEVFDKMEVFVDGGIMRGTDIFKALCLGAKSVGIGRGFLYSLNYGQEGVEKYVDILRDELETTMKMCGITDLTQVHPGLLNTLKVDHLIPSSGEHPYAKWRPKSMI